MNFTPAPTLISTVVSLFRKSSSQPTFTPANPPVPTQVYVTRSTTMHVDPPVDQLQDSTTDTDQPSTADKKRKDRSLSLHIITDISEKKKHYNLYPETPRAPNPQHTTFVLPIHAWNTAERGGSRCSLDDDQASVCEVEHARVCDPAENGAYPEPKTLARALFFFGFVFPPFWVAGFVIIWIPLRTTRDWEAGRNSMEIKWGCSVIRETELRWARRCLLALLSEVLVVVLVVVIVKWGVKARF